MGPGFLEHPLVWAFSIFLAGVWLSRLLAAALHMHKIAEITDPEYEVSPASASGRARRVSIIVPARNEAEHIEAGLLSLLELEYPDYEVIAVDDRSDDATGAILDRLETEWRKTGESSPHLLKVLHVTELPMGWLGRPTPCGRQGSKRPATGCCLPMPMSCFARMLCAVRWSMPNVNRRITSSCFRLS